MEPSKAPHKSRVDVPVFLSWKEAQNMMQGYLTGMEFNINQFSVTIEQVAVREQAQKVFLSLHTSGTYDGEIQVTCHPVFNPSRNKIEFEDFDLKMETGNFFQKGMVLLLRGAIEKQLEKALDMTLDQPIGDLLERINLLLTDFKATPQLSIKGTIDRLEVISFSYSALGLQLRITAEGQLAFFIA